MTKSGTIAFSQAVLRPRRNRGGRGRGLGPSPLRRDRAARTTRFASGLIGSGSRGRSVAAQFIRSYPDVQYVANCDAYATRLEQGTEQLSGLQKDVKIEGYEDYRRILDRKDVDVVHIATPDHWHCQMLIDAMAAGKDVYLEKPLSNTVERAVEALSAYKSSNRVVQFGTQQRSGSHFQEAAKIVQDGQLGKITHAVIQFPGNGYGTPPEAEAPVPQGLNWELFQGPAPETSVQAGPVALARMVGLRRWSHHRLGCPSHRRGAVVPQFAAGRPAPDQRHGAVCELRESRAGSVSGRVLRELAVSELRDDVHECRGSGLGVRASGKLLLRSWWEPADPSRRLRGAACRGWRRRSWSRRSGRARTRRQDRARRRCRMPRLRRHRFSHGACPGVRAMDPTATVRRSRTAAIFSIA